MKCAIIYFSQTGGTKKVAQAIATGIQAAGLPVDLFEMHTIDTTLLASYDVIGIGSPVFYYQIPFNVTDFINALPAQNGALWFAFVSHGTIPATALQSITLSLKNKAATVLGCHHCYADGRLPYYPYPTLTTGHPDTLDLEESTEFGKSIARLTLRARAGEDIPSVQPAPLPKEERWVFKELDLYQPKTLRAMLPPLHIDANRCTTCGICAKICPVGGIDPLSNPPRIQSPCIFCFRCSMDCPSGAISGDYALAMVVTPASTARHKKSVDAARTEGRFTYHINLNDIQYDTPLFVQQDIKRKGPFKNYRLNGAFKAMRYAAHRLGMRDAIVWMVRIKLMVTGQWNRRTDLKNYY